MKTYTATIMVVDDEDGEIVGVSEREDTSAVHAAMKAINSLALEETNVNWRFDAACSGSHKRPFDDGHSL